MATKDDYIRYWESQGISLADLEPVVRCKDCKRFRQSTMYPNWGICLIANDEGYGAWREVRKDCFCSWGERKGEQTEYHIENDGTYEGGE